MRIMLCTDIIFFEMAHFEYVESREKYTSCEKNAVGFQIIILRKLRFSFGVIYKCPNQQILES